MMGAVFWHIFIKDILRLKKEIIGYLCLGLFSILVMGIPKEVFGFIGSLFLVTAIVAFYSHMTLKSIVLERKEGNHLFLMTLPISVRQLSYTKLLSSVAAFAFVWGVLFVCVILFLFVKDTYPAVSMAFYSVIFGLYLPAFFILLTVALLTTKGGWTILAIVVTNTITGIAINFFPKVISIQKGNKLGDMRSAGIVWPEVTNTILIWELSIAMVFVILAVYVSSKKATFI